MAASRAGRPRFGIKNRKGIMTPPLGNSKTSPSPSTSTDIPKSSISPYQPIPEENFAASLKSVKRWTLTLDGGWGARDLQNDQGYDHSGAYLRIAGGLRFRPRPRHSLSTRLFFDYQGLHKDLGQGVQSNASSKAVGAELDYGFAIHPKWFSAHALLGLGASLFSAKEVEFSKNAQLLPFNSTGTRVDLGAKLCTWRDALCLTLGIALDYGLSERLKFVDPSTSNPPFGLNATGAKAGASVDVMRVVENLRKNREEEVAASIYTPPKEPVEDGVKLVRVQKPLLAVEDGVKPLPKPKTLGSSAQVFVPTVKVAVKTKKSGAELLLGKDLFVYWELESENLQKQAANLGLEGRIRRDQIQLEYRKTNPDLKIVRRLAEEDIEIFAKSLRNLSEIESAAGKLKNAAKDLRLDYKELREATRILKKVQRNQGMIYRLAQLTHHNVGKAVQAYNSKAAKAEHLSFPARMKTK